MVTIIVIYGIICLIFLLVFWKTIRYKLKADRLGVPISWSQLIGQSVRKTLSDEILEAASLAKKENLKIDIMQLETHKLATGNPLKVVQRIVEAKRRGKHLDYKTAAAVDLAGKN